LDQSGGPSTRDPIEPRSHDAERVTRMLAGSPESPEVLLSAMRRCLDAGLADRALAAAQTHRVARTQIRCELLEPLLREVASASAGANATTALLLLARHQVRWSHLVPAQLTLAELAERELDSETLVQVALLRARAFLRQGSPDKARHVLEDAGRAVRGDVRLPLMLAEVELWRGSVAEGRRLLQSLPLGDRGALAGRRAASVALSFVLDQDGPNALSWTATARSAYEVDVPPLVAALEVIALVLMEDLDRASVVTDSLDKQPLASAFARGLGHALQAFVCWRRGELVESIALGEPALELLDEEADRAVGPLLANALARAHLGLGQPRRAEELLRKAEGSCAASGLQALGTACEVTRLLLSAMRGQWNEARSHAQAAIALCPRSPSVSVEASWALGALEVPSACTDSTSALAALRGAEAALHRADWTAAERAAAAAERWYRRSGAQHDRAQALLARAEAHVQLGDDDQADKLLSACEELARRHRYRIIETALCLLRARSADRQGRIGDYVAALRGVPETAGPEIYSHALREARLRVGIADGPPIRCEGQPMRDRVRRLGLGRDCASVVGLRGRVWLLSSDDPLPPCDLVVHVERNALSRGEEQLPLSAQAIDLLVQLSGTSSQKSVEELYLSVWRAESYHPLRHRNTVYVAINRLRSSVERWLGRELLQRHGDAGYTLAPDLRVAVSSAPAAAPPERNWALGRWRAS
jgi:tetratricopeptide (TPR) repeat protein